MTDPRPLATGFAPVGRDEWEAAVTSATNGRGVASLTRTLPEGFEVAPLATSDDAPAGFTMPRADDAPWGIRVVARHPDVEVANRTLLEELERGACEVHLRLDLATRAGDGDGRGIDGVAVVDASALAALLDGVLLDLAPVAMDAGASFLAAGRALLEVADGHVVAGLRLGADPIGSLATTGSLPQGMEQALTDVATLASAAATRGGAVRAVAVDTAATHDAGATEELDLAVALATGVAYLRAMTDGDLAIEDAADQIEFRLPVGVDQFVGMAKLRAFRRLWQHVLVSCGVDAPRPALVHASLGAGLVTRRDPWSNMLRGTVACFAAAVGGADSVTVPPFDSALGLSGELGRRVARNTQLVLQREGHLARVADPSAGSFHVETLTADLAAQAWATFQRIEAEGGMVAALVDGHVHDGIARRREAREARVATRRRAITGVSEFPLLDERQPDVTPADEAAPDHANPSAFLPREGPWTHVEPLIPAPVAAPFEALRDRAESGASRPTIFLANLGALARHTARATFAANLFASGGIEALANEGFEHTPELVEAFATSGARLAVVCGDDDQYAELGAEVVAALQGAGATVFLAGKPDPTIPADGFVHLGADVVDALATALDVTDGR